MNKMKNIMILKKKITKNNKDINKQPILNNSNNQEKNPKVKQKIVNFKPKTPIKEEKVKNNNRINANNATISLSNNNNNDTNNNLSLNVNMTNKESNKNNKLITGIKNKSANKKKPIGLKKDEKNNKQNK